MGSGESTTRKVSFGVDDEDRVRILRGIKLSEDVLQRMRGVANIPPQRVQKDTGATFSATSSTKPQQNPQQHAHLNTQSKPSKTAAKVQEEQWRADHQKSILREETRKGKEDMIKEMSQERQHTREEAEKTRHLNLEIYAQSKEKFHQAATMTESNVRSRSTDGVCPGLQAQILSCYKVNGQQTLRCSDLAKEYMRCINVAKRLLAFKHHAVSNQEKKRCEYIELPSSRGIFVNLIE
ncbi:MICOS complex subunit mic25a isoform X3 [Corythoichthys intestinalis]|uniref:MICOS complex subunit mic25a isoform X3 n=1 Tax=Corythoichthys intestinalis TaxID=161448 RepID=UPI0025A61CB2|nr:MICOS complex subunit mic25a isoform X3 [Corythoichthys intestinalis]